MLEAIVQWRIVVVFKQQKNLWLPPVAPGLLSIIVAVLRGQQPPRFSSLFPGARTIQSPAGGCCVCEITHCGYVVQAYHPAPLGAADPIEGCILCYRNVRHFLPPDDDADYLVETLLSQNGASWFKPPHCTIRNHRGYFRRLEAPLTFGKKSCSIIFWGGWPAGAAAGGGAGMPYQPR